MNRGKWRSSAYRTLDRARAERLCSRIAIAMAMMRHAERQSKGKVPGDQRFNLQCVLKALLTMTKNPVFPTGAKPAIQRRETSDQPRPLILVVGVGRNMERRVIQLVSMVCHTRRDFSVTGKPDGIFGALVHRMNKYENWSADRARVRRDRWAQSGPLSARGSEWLRGRT